MEQPMWFYCDQELQYEAATRNLRTQNVRYNFGTVNKPHRTFRKAFATLFDIRSLEEFFFEKATHGQRRKNPSTIITPTKR